MLIFNLAYKLVVQLTFSKSIKLTVFKDQFTHNDYSCVVVRTFTAMSFLAYWISFKLIKHSTNILAILSNALNNIVALRSRF